MGRGTGSETILYGPGGFRRPAPEAAVGPAATDPELIRASADEVLGAEVRVEWARLGEGYNGDYDPTDPNDVELLRFDVSARAAGAGSCTAADPDSGWEPIEDGSYCTLTPADTAPAERQRLLELIYAELADDVRSGRSVKRKCEELSYVDPSWRG